MTQALSYKAVLFADLRGSTALYEELGNANATLLVTRSVAALAEALIPSGGRLIKTLGDGLMALFEQPAGAVQAASDMHASIERAGTPSRRSRSAAPLHVLKLQVTIALGEVAEVEADVFGDAVNVAARLLDHAGDGETLITDPLLQALSPRQRNRFRNLDWVHLRGRNEPVLVHVLGGRRGDAGAVTQFEGMAASVGPGALRLSWDGKSRVLRADQLPAVLGRSAQSILLIEDPRVSRLHARLDWHGSSFHLSDLSFNGTSVRFEGHAMLNLRRTSSTLHGRGEIGLSGPPGAPGVTTVGFEVLDFADTQPRTATPDSRG